MIRRPPRSTRTDTSFPTRRSSDLTAHVPVIGDIELFAEAAAELSAHRVAGITGTNGKSTVTALVTPILEGARIPALMRGNISLPIPARAPLPAGGYHVLQLPSIQKRLAPRPSCCVAWLTHTPPPTSPPSYRLAPS